MPFDPVTGAAVAEGMITAGQKWKWFRDITFGQVLILILIGILSTASYGIWQQTINSIVPSHLKSIQDGYERIDANHTATALEAHRMSAERTQSFNKIIDKMSDRMDAKDEFIQRLVRQGTTERSEHRADDREKQAEKKKDCDKKDDGGGADGG